MPIFSFSKNVLFPAAASTAAAVCFCLCCFSCAAQTGSADPFFIQGNSVFLADVEPVPLFKVEARVPQRSLSRLGDNIIMWNKNTGMLETRDTKGRILSSHKLEADFVHLQDSQLLTRGAVYHDNEGFDFTLLHWNMGELETVLSVRLDLFPSDIVFLNDGRLCAAGVTRQGDSAVVYLLEAETGKTRQLLQLPRTETFPRLVYTGSRMLLFFSPRELQSRDLRLYIADLSSDEPYSFKEYTKTTNGVSDFFGYGFAMEQTAFLPAVLENGNLVLMPLQLGSTPRSASFIPDSGAVFLPLGPTADKNGFWYLAWNPLDDTSTPSLAKYSDGTVLTTDLFKQ